MIEFLELTLAVLFAVCCLATTMLLIYNEQFITIGTVVIVLNAVLYVCIAIFLALKYPVMLYAYVPLILAAIWVIDKNLITDHKFNK